MSVYLPRSIYERLPFIYFVLAATLALTPFSGIKWVVIVGLLLAAITIKRQRTAYRKDRETQAAIELMEKRWK